ncbi:MAG TPA: hypothetical protein VHV08_14480 [Pirellulales bacterium]|nr:hypothetical protein [Pirellulales bacterium]
MAGQGVHDSDGSRSVGPESIPKKRVNGLDIAHAGGDNVVAATGLRERRLPIRKDYAMGDKGGKKDKEKSKKQKASKHDQLAKGKQDKNRPK